MTFRRLARFSACVVVCLASGTLECTRHGLTPTQRRGEELYTRTCAVCHGAAGEGYVADQATALAQPDFLASVTDGYLRKAIELGREGTTMSAWSTLRGGPLGPVDVDAVIAFVRTWDRRARASLDESPATGDAARGAALYAAQCVKCHGVRGAGGPNVHIGSRSFLESAGNGFLRYAIRHGRTGTGMPRFDGILGETGIEDAVALLRSWQAADANGPAPPAVDPPPPPPLPLGPVPLNPRGPEPRDFQVFPVVTGADVVKRELDRHARMAILDARAPSDFVTEHIAGAVSVPFYGPEPYIASLPKDAWIVCYCACPHAESGQLARKLMAQGFSKVTVLDEGLNFWRQKNYPIHKGVSP